MSNEHISQKLEVFSQRGWTLKPYRMWKADKPCPPRLVVNPYKGCDFKHRYCYIRNGGKPQQNFRVHLSNRIAEAKKLGLENLLVIVSSSTDPFQPIEREHRDSLFALNSLLSNDFSILVMTRYPQMLLEQEYQESTKNPKLYVDVSIPSTQEHNLNSIFYSEIAPSLEDSFGTIKKLSDLGKRVRVKVEPIIPSVNGIIGQSKEELDEIVKYSKNAGAKKIISKTLRLNEDVPQFIYDKLIKYYESNGIKEMNTLALKDEIRKELLGPVFEACQEYNIPFCSCVDSDVFTEQTSHCLLDGK